MSIHRNITQTYEFRNRLLQAISGDDRHLLAQHLSYADLPKGKVFSHAGEPITQVYFVESGVASIVARLPDDDSLEVGVVGREGMTDVSVILGGISSPFEVNMQIAGSGFGILAERLLEAFNASPPLHALLLRYVLALSVQTGSTALADGKFKLSQRLARWILMCHDRVDGDDVPITHELLATMLGVRRSGVTEAIQVFEDSGAIKATRGHIFVVDRGILVRTAGPCYGMPEAEYQRLIG